ncbi:MAG: hypothetical protein OXF93_02920 [Acidobacteria bacterium]|nr:hypothetical protein [Acidobacteriota bacterium]
MSFIVPRTCTEILEDDTRENRAPRSGPLAAFREAPAYVLLGDPGSGKTTAFEAESEALGDDARFVTARDFLTFDSREHPEWQGKTLFIDGLDEARAGGRDFITTLDELRGRLDALKRPRFRLSCREADWLGANDRNRLAAVSPATDLAVLRLDPLSEDDIRSILSSHPGVEDSDSFVATAREKGVAGFLTNPQSLTLLADVVSDGAGWPKGRRELFEDACRRMLRERNEEHIAAADQPSASPCLSEDDLLDAAGRLCAVLLTSGTPGCAISSPESADYPGLNRCVGQQAERCRHAVASKLFKAVGPVAEGRFQPVHRHVAEFLAGRDLARLIEGGRRSGRGGRQGVPARRIVALITGDDGGVPTELRGLSAWIAAHSPFARNELLERDPIGLGLYGDVGRFSTPEKRDLLASLERVSSRLHLAAGASAAFESLATSVMQPAIEEILRDDHRGPKQESFLGFVLNVLRHGSALPGLADRLLALVRDEASSPWIREAALRAFLHNSPEGAEKTDSLKRLLRDLHAGTISDADHELRGILLTRLYPREVPPSAVWSYFVATADPNSLLSWRLFWAHRIPEESSDTEAVELLDGLAQRVSEAGTSLEPHDGERAIARRLLARVLPFCGDAVGIERLYGWLRTGVAGVLDDQWKHDGSVRDIGRWLEQRPETGKAVLLEGLRHCAAGAEFSKQAFEVRCCLYDAPRPPDYGLWCLRQAVTMADSKLLVAQYLLWEACRAHKDGKGDEGLSRDVLATHVRQNEKLRPVWDLVTRPLTLPDEAEERRIDAEGRQQGDDEWLDQVRSEKPALNENRAAPALLFRMACTYFGVDRTLGTASGPTGVAQLLREDRDLTRAALAGLRGAIDRPDVPEIDAILDLRRQNRMHYLAWPYLAGLAELERKSPEDVPRWDERRMRKALAFYFCHVVPDHSPKWYGRLLDARPELVADALAGVAATGFHSDGSDSPVLWMLAHDRAHARVAQLASLRLLAHFPTRCTAKQLRSLDLLLRAGLQYADTTRLLDLVDSKLSRRSMNDAQRIRWLACGMLAAPGRYESRLRDFADGRERRVRQLTDFLFADDAAPPWRPPLGKKGQRLLIRLLAPCSDPDGWLQAGVVTPAMWATRRVSGMIGDLAALPDEDVTGILEELTAEPTLSRWRSVLVQAKEDHRVVRRDASYRHPGIEQICRTLDDGPPANAADLAALVADRLEEMASRIRNDNSNGWRPFWNEVEHRRAETPKHEESCRDVLLEALRHSLPDEVDVQPEGRYANDKRADLRIASRDFQIPVEIKKYGHPRLWSALHEQLIAQYARDPATDGYGIYLVLWFGEVQGRGTPPPATGKRPAGPDALRPRLEQQLTPEEARKISICVIDVSAPPMTAG